MLLFRPYSEVIVVCGASSDGGGDCEFERTLNISVYIGFANLQRMVSSGTLFRSVYLMGFLIMRQQWDDGCGR